MYNNKFFRILRSPVLALLIVGIINKVLLSILTLDILPEEKIFILGLTISLDIIIAVACLTNLWEAIMDHSREISCIMYKIVGKMVKTYFRMRRQYCKIRREYRGWKKERETEKFLAELRKGDGCACNVTKHTTW